MTAQGETSARSLCENEMGRTPKERGPYPP